MVPTAVHHIAIKAVDLPRLERFYCDVLGLSVLRRWPAPDGAGDRSVWLDLGAGGIEAFLALERASQPRPALGEEEPGLHMLAMRITRDDRDAWIDRLGQAGVAVYRQTDYTIYVKDPEGNRIGLSHWPDAR
jgi:catechol 2,3-dioxygenase-like lactoylglutathione lyase family enzyme